MKRIISQVKRLMPWSKAVGHAPAGDLVGELAEECLRAGAHDDAGGVAADDVGAHEADVRQVERIVAVARRRRARISRPASPRR